MTQRKSLTLITELIKKFEIEKYNLQKINQKSGAIYTPPQVADYMVSNILKFQFKNFFKENGVDAKKFSQEGSFQKLMDVVVHEQPEIKIKFLKELDSWKILDPSCGSGRFLVSAANSLFTIIKYFNKDKQGFQIKKEIIQKNIHGIELEKPASFISKLRLIAWLYSENGLKLSITEKDMKNSCNDNNEGFFDNFNTNFNIHQMDFLLEYDPDPLNLFDLIIGNPPYVENKKIQDGAFKKELYKKFNSAYKLFDLSVVFLEKSLALMKKNKGFLSFLMTNKFLSADYGVKIREVLASKTELKEILDISSLPIFTRAAAYPIVLSLKKSTNNKNNLIKIRKYERIDQFLNHEKMKSWKLPQKLLHELPEKVIPISSNVELISFIFSNYKSMSHSLPDLKIIYRPFGFLNWAKNFDNISEERNSNDDLILLGTGSVDKYFIKFEKRIRIAKKNITVQYIKFDNNHPKNWKNLQKEKLIIREIAKDLTCVYDPGVFANITGLYHILVPSFDTNKLFCLLVIMNSNLMDSIFKTLFSSLHMSGGFLRFNGSFIKRLPMPKCFPDSLSKLGKILQVLSQLRYDLKTIEGTNLINHELISIKTEFLDDIEKILTFFNELSNSLTILLYLSDHDSFSCLNREKMNNLLYSLKILPDVQFSFCLKRFELPKYIHSQKNELKLALRKIFRCYSVLNGDSDLITEIKGIQNCFMRLVL